MALRDNLPPSRSLISEITTPALWIGAGACGAAFLFEDSYWQSLLIEVGVSLFLFSAVQYFSFGTAISRRVVVALVVLGLTGIVAAKFVGGTLQSCLLEVGVGSLLFVALELWMVDLLRKVVDERLAKLSDDEDFNAKMASEFRRTGGFGYTDAQDMFSAFFGNGPEFQYTPSGKIFPCAGCSTKLRIPHIDKKLVVRCPKCKRTRFVVPLSGRSQFSLSGVWFGLWYFAVGLIPLGIFVSESEGGQSIWAISLPWFAAHCVVTWNFYNWKLWALDVAGLYLCGSIVRFMVAISQSPEPELHFIKLTVILGFVIYGWFQLRDGYAYMSGKQ